MKNYAYKTANILCCTSLFLVSCFTPNMNPQNQTVGSFNTAATKPNANPNDVSITIDPGAFDKKYSGMKKVSLDHKPQTNQGFSIQSTSSGDLFDQIEQDILNKANELIGEGKAQCVYLPPSGQQQNANCNSSDSGFQCSGALNQTLSSASCPEMVIYSGATNINHDILNSKLWISSTNNLTLNKSVHGIFSTRGDLNTSIDNTSHMQGVFVGARSNNFNMGGSAKLEGLYSILDPGVLSMNLNASAIFDGEMCTAGSANINRAGNSQMIYNPSQLTNWRNDLSVIDALSCEAGTKPYTQINTTPTPAPTPQPVRPILDCVRHNDNGTYTAFFGYLNQNTTLIDIPIGQNNKFTPSPQDRGQPSSFNPGRTSYYPNSAFSVNFSGGNLVWSLDGRTSTASDNPAQKCNDDPVPSPTPSIDPSASPDPNNVQFDPADPSSLGDLYPGVPGNNNNQYPETEFAHLEINGVNSYKTEQAKIKVEFVNNTPENVDLFIQKYGAEQLNYEELSNYYTFQVDLTKVNIENLKENIITLNGRSTSENYINTVSLNNLESAKTFALAVELLVSEEIASAHPIYTSDKLFSGNESYENNGLLVGSKNASDSWWLNEQSTNIINAWRKYGRGYSWKENRPITIAVLDGSFNGLNEYMTASSTTVAKEFDLSKIRLDLGGIANKYVAKNINVLPWLQTSSLSWVKTPIEQESFPSITCQNAKDAYPGFIRCPFISFADPIENPLFNTTGSSHGMSVLATMAAEANNGIGTSGVASQAEYIPIRVDASGVPTPESIIKALQHVKNLLDNGIKIDVVNMSFGLVGFDNYQDYFTDYYSLSPFVKDIVEIIKELRNRKVVVVVAAGNSAHNVVLNKSFSYKDFYKDIVIVGGTEDTNQIISNPKNDLIRYNSIGNEVIRSDGSIKSAVGSNYGDLVDVWAPGRDVAVASKNTLGLTVKSNFGGTSSAAPITSGVIALLKAFNSDIDVTTIKNLFREDEFEVFRDDLNVRVSAPYKTNFLPFFQNSECGRYIHCGELTTNPKRISMKLLDAERAADIITSASERNIEYSGKLRKSGDKIYLDTSSNSYQLSWGSIEDIQLLQNLYVTSITNSNPSQIKNLLSTNYTINLSGKVKNGKIYFSSSSYAQVASPTPNPTATPVPAPSDKNWTLEVFNVDDLFEVKIDNWKNTVTLQTRGWETNPVGKRKVFSLNQYLVQGENIIDIAAINTEQTNVEGASWGIEIKADGKSVFRDVRGSAHKHTYTDKFGANMQNPSFGPIMQGRFYLYSNLAGDPNGGPYTVKVYNTSDLSTVKVKIDNGDERRVVTVDANSTWTGADLVLDSFLNFDALNKISFEVDSSFITYPNPGGSNHPNSSRYSWGFDVYQGNKLIFRDRDGQREMLQFTTSVKGTLMGAGAFFNKPASYLGEQVYTNELGLFVR